MAELLEKTGSSYFISFKEIFRDCVAGRLSENEHKTCPEQLIAFYYKSANKTFFK
jgi:hypothetical protein